MLSFDTDELIHEVFEFLVKKYESIDGRMEGT